MRGALVKLWYLPTVFRLGLLYADAVGNVRDRRFEEAKAKLIRIRERSPRQLGIPAPATLLLAFVYLRTGNLISAADVALEGVGQVERLKFLKPPERAYLSYAGKLIYECATSMTGEPRALHLGIGIADLKLEEVRPEIKDSLPLAELAATGQPIH